jgi:hypothetical protein
MGTLPKCGYECGAQATVDFLWPNDAEVWHVCDAHASALQNMLDEQRGAEWAARVVRWPSQSAGGETGPRSDVANGAMTAATEAEEPDAERIDRRRPWLLLWRIRRWLSR